MDSWLLNQGCGDDYLELRDGPDADSHLVWRKCGSNFSKNEVFELSGNTMFLLLTTTARSNTTFIAKYGKSQRTVQLEFGAQPAGPPAMVGSPLSVPWYTVEPIPKSGGSWVGLYIQGTCDEDNEWRHQCYLAAHALPVGTSEGVVEFGYMQYRSAAGYYELRFFTGDSQGMQCNVQNRQHHDAMDDWEAYSRCQLVALARTTVYMAAPGSVPQTRVAGTREFDSQYLMFR